MPEKETLKEHVDIEDLLRWAYLDELPKRQLSSAEEIWNGIAEYGQRGGIDIGQGAAQRYPHFGLPHSDALAIERAPRMRSATTSPAGPSLVKRWLFE